MSTLGRSDDNPLWVISQKALTGHPKGAAAAWQMNGLMQAMATGVIPGNHSLDDVDADMQRFPRLVWSDRAFAVPRAAIKAGVVTTLGFGHVSALVVLGHPFLFWRMLSDAQRKTYEAQLTTRTQRGTQRLQAVLSGREPLFVAREQRPFSSPEQEARFLTDAAARLPVEGKTAPNAAKAQKADPA
jgi:fatty acid synthase